MNLNFPLRSFYDYYVLTHIIAIGSSNVYQN